MKELAMTYLMNGTGIVVLLGAGWLGWGFIKNMIEASRGYRKVDAAEAAVRKAANKKLSEKADDIAAVVKLIEKNKAVEKKAKEKIKTIVIEAAYEIDKAMASTSVAESVDAIDEALR